MSRTRQDIAVPFRGAPFGGIVLSYAGRIAAGLFSISPVSKTIRRVSEETS